MSCDNQFLPVKGTRLMMERPRVISSVYCSSSLIDIPRAKVVTMRSVNFDNFL